MKRYSLLLFILFLFASCEYDFKPDIDNGGALYAIEGDILIGRVSSFKATRVIAMSFGDFSEMNQVNATFWVEDDQGVIYRQEKSEKPNIATVDLTGASDQRKYRLVTEIETGSSETLRYASSWMEPEPLPDVEVSVEDNIPDKNIYLSVGGSSGYYRWEYERLISVSSLLEAPGYEYSPATGKVIKRESGWWPYSFCWNVQHPGVSRVYSSDLLPADFKGEILIFVLSNYEISRSVSLRLIIRSLSEGAYRYLTALNKSSEISGSLLSPLPGEIVGNILNVDDPSDYAVGYISVCNCAVVYIQKDNLVSPAYDLVSRYVVEGIDEEDYKKYYDRGFVPYDSEDRWVPYRCVDCRTGGNLLEKPKGWD